MLARRQKPHSARLLFLGASMALVGLMLSVSIVMLKYPRHREICSGWAGPAKFEPHMNKGSPIVVGSVPRTEMVTIEDLNSLKAESHISQFEFDFLAEQLTGTPSIKLPLVDMSPAAQKYYNWMKEVNEKLPFIPILPLNATNAYDEVAIELWITTNRCIRPMSLDSSSANDPLSQRVIRRVMSSGTLVSYCCKETRLELFFPPTISESIRDWSAPEGRIFFGFMIIASVLVLFSSHPYSLSNVCSAHDSVFGFLNTAWLRNYFPPIGLMLVACVPTVPVDVMYSLAPTYDDVIVNLIMFSVHMCGAIGSFFGYAMAEVWALNILPEKIDSLEDEIQDTSDIIFQKQLHHNYQRLFRILAVLIILGGCTFFTVGFTIVMFAGCQKYFVLNEAWLLFFRVTTYFAEAAAAAGLGISFLVIWYYCPERFVTISIERDFLVLEQFVSYLEGHEGMSTSLADKLEVAEGPLRTKIQELERETYREFESIRRQRNELIRQLQPATMMALGATPSPASPGSPEMETLLTPPPKDVPQDGMTINFTEGIFKRRMLKNMFHKAVDHARAEQEMQSLFIDNV